MFPAAVGKLGGAREDVTYHKLEIDSRGAALRIRFARPEVLNALDSELLDELADAARGPAADPAVRAVMITGSGRGFSAGADLGAMPLDADIGVLLERHYHPVVRALAALDKPVVAAVNGIAAGAGMSLALACDVRYVSEAAAFVLGFAGIGLALDAGASYHLPRLIGAGRALELTYSNRRVDAAEALAIGLADRVLPAEDFEEAAFAAVGALAAGPTRAFALIKREIRASFDNDLEGQLAFESACQSAAATGSDAAEGVRAFAEKRAPRFEGR